MFDRRKHDPAKLGFEELMELKQRIDHEIATRQDTEVAALKSKVLAVAAALAVTPAELLGVKPEPAERRSRRQPRAKYRDPDNPENTWTGKGRMPKWLQEKLEQGAIKEQFLAS